MDAHGPLKLGKPLNLNMTKSAPPATEIAILEAGMSGLPFNPGRPVGPFNGYSTTPRSHDFLTGYNISARPRQNERVTFDTLRGIVDAYDFAQICIWHKIDSLRSLKWNLIPAPRTTGNQSDAIAYAERILAKPDRKTRLKTVFAKYLYDIFAFDAGALARIRNNAGQVIGFKHVDGTTIAPLIDDWGDRPDDPAPAYVQFVQGVPFNWLTEADIIYEPFRPSTNSPYGRAPIEAVLLNANTDLRFQVYFMQHFTEGNIPEAFAGSPEDWSPDQISEFQDSWDALLYGDQAQLHQIKWVPHGTTFAWSNEKVFDDQFSLFMARKTMAAYHIVPSDLGITEDVNRATSDTQADVQFRVGDLPGIDFLQETMNSFLQDDLHVPLCFEFDTGQEVQDRLADAQAWKIATEGGAVSVDEWREQVYGLPIDAMNPMPRFMFSAKSGAVPLSAILAIAGPTDPETGAPLDTVPLDPARSLRPAEGVVPVKEPGAANFSRADTDPDEPAFPALEVDEPGSGQLAAPVAKGADEVVVFRRFVKGRQRAGVWRDFQFTTVDPGVAYRLNQAGRAQVRKAAGEVVAAGSGNDDPIPPVGPDSPGDMDPQPDPQDPGFIAKSDPRWEAHPVRRVEDALASAHAGPVQAALAGSVTREQLQAVVAAYIAAQPDA